jgi:RNA polymerase sigma-70 factor (ECF subfamily)
LHNANNNPKFRYMSESIIKQDEMYSLIKEKCEKVFKAKYQIFDEDVIYDCMLSIILQYQTNKDHIDNLTAYLNGAIHHQFCLYLRRKNKQKYVLFEEAMSETESFLDNDIETENKEDKQLKISKLKDKMVDLKPPQSDIIQMRFFDNLSYTEISEKLKLTEVNIRKHYSRALKKLSEIN